MPKLSGEIATELLGRVSEVALINDVVAIEHGPGLVGSFSHSRTCPVRVLPGVWQNKAAKTPTLVAVLCLPCVSWPAGWLRRGKHFATTTAICIELHGHRYSYFRCYEGIGTTSYIPVFTGSHTVSNSVIYQSNGKIGIGTTTARSALDIFGGIGSPSPSFPGPILVLGELRDSTNTAVDLASATSGYVIGVDGVTYSPAGNGVLGNFASTDSQGGGGVAGLTNATSGFSYGARGDALGTTGTAVGVFGQTFSADGCAAIFVNRANGNLSQSPDIPVFRVDGRGKVFANGGFQRNGADFAESMAVTGDHSKYAAGDLLEPIA